MAGKDETQISPLYVVLIGLLSTAIMLIVYHCILEKCRRRRTALSLPQSHRILLQEEGTQSGLESSFAQLIQAHRYSKEAGKGGEGEDTCAVCLCKFKEGEEVRRLPDSLHSFHVPCIDMWFCSHSNCPLCRTDMAPSPVLPVGPLVPPDFGRLPHIGG